MIEVIEGDCLTVLPTLADESVHAIVTDPPAGISFMGRAWDGDKGGRDQWIAWMEQIAAECLRVIKPGGHALVWALPRTSHWTATAWENAGWQVRDRVAHLFGSGFPKSLNVSKAIDRELGLERHVIGIAKGKGGENLNKLARVTGRNNDGARGCGAYGQGARQITVDIPVTAPATPEAQQWDGWGTSLKPACEDWWLLRKPLAGIVAQNVLTHGCGALNIDASRVTTEERLQGSTVRDDIRGGRFAAGHNPNPGDIAAYTQNSAGRWPANVLHDGSAEVLEAFAAFGTTGGGNARDTMTPSAHIGNAKFGYSDDRHQFSFGDTGTAARFFAQCSFSEDELRFHYSAKADKDDRADSKHPTVKPVELLKWLVRLITPPGGKILDPFGGSGTTGEAAMLLGFDCTLIEREPQSAADIRHRIKRWSGEDLPLFQDAAQ